LRSRPKTSTTASVGASGVVAKVEAARVRVDLRHADVLDALGQRDERGVASRRGVGADDWYDRVEVHARRRPGSLHYMELMLICQLCPREWQDGRQMEQAAQ